MSKIRLFIENKEVELNNEVQFNITKQFEDLSNPTVIINEWSKTVSIPFSQTNNKIFGFSNVIDRYPTVSSSGDPIGLNFDPNRRLNFRLQDGESVVMEGYAKVNSITQQKGNGVYNITLNGQMGNIFKEIQKIGFDYDTSLSIGDEENKYKIDTREYFNEPISKELVYECWTSNGNNLDSIQDAYDGTRYNITPNDFIGFAPNNARIEDFDYKSVDVFDENEGIRKVRTFSEIVDADQGRVDMVGLSGDAIMPNGLLPREFGDYRSYLQIPYCYWHILWGIFQKKAEDLTGYKFELDKRWFNKHNPYWRNLAYVLKSFNPKDLQNTKRSVGVRYNYSEFIVNYSSNPNISNSATFRTPDVPDINYIGFEEGESVKVNLQIPLKFLFSCSYAPIDDLEMHNHFFINIWFKSIYGRSFCKKILVVGNDTIYQSVLDDQDIIKIVNMKDFIKNAKVERVAGEYRYIVQYIFNAYTFISSSVLRDMLDYNIGIDTEMVPIRTNGQTYNWRFEIMISHPIYGPSTEYLNFHITYEDLTDKSVITCDEIRTRRDPTTLLCLNDFWNNEVKPFDEILRYCKLFNIYIDVDIFNKKIRFVQKNNYFADYTIEDWTDKVDYSKDYILETARGDKKYLLFNYEDSKVGNNENYKTKYGYNFGELRFNTLNNFNDDTEKLFKNNKISITNSPNILSWTRLFNENYLSYLVPAESFIDCSDKDGKIVDPFGSFYFYNGITKFDNSDGLRYPWISIDTPQQTENDTYYYYETPGDDEYSMAVNYYPVLSTVFNNKSITYALPKENYSFEFIDTSSLKSLYDLFWKNYMNEKYSSFNKKFTCYLKMDKIDFQNFKFNHFVKINNVLYLVNKIFDYNPVKPTAKVELLSIDSISNYNDNNFAYLYLDSYELNSYYHPETDTKGSFKAFSNKPIIIKSVESSKGLTIDNVSISGNTISYNAGRIQDLIWDGYITVGVDGDDTVTATYHIHQSQI